MPQISIFIRPSCSKIVVSLSSNLFNFRKMAIGDYVRFLNQVGEGEIVRKDGDKFIVRDSDGFEWPMLEKELVVIRQSKIDEIKVIGTVSTYHKSDATKPSKLSSTRTGGKNIQEKIVDLHQEALCYGTSRMSSVEIHELQKRTIINTLNQERLHHGTQIIFVHGKGAGVLRAELIGILKKNKAFCTYEDASFQKYGYQGAIKVIIK